jgi:flagellar hook-associated protein 3 FlgL
MTMRTPNPMDSAQSLLDLQRSKERYGGYVNQLSSGNRVTNLGDDPTGAALISDFQTSIDRNNQYMAQIDNASNLLQGTESALDAVNNNLTRVLELGQEGMTEGAGPMARQAISKEVAALGNDLIATANSKQQGKFLFGGTRTTTQPFGGVVPAAKDKDNKDLRQTVAYHGDSNAINLDVSTSTKVTTNLPGDAVFYGPGGPGSATDVFAAVQALNDGLKADDTEKITQAYHDIEAIAVRINDTLTEVGGRQGGMESLKSGMSAYNASLNSIQSNIQSTDYPTTITSLNKENQAQQATLSVMAKANAKNLFDYIG